MKEIWRDIVGYEGLYQVSNKGRVYSMKRSGCSGVFLKKSITQNGYCRSCLSKMGVPKTFKTHRLVAQAFIPNPENKPFVNHIDGNKLNNCVDNLEWCTQSENVNHAIQNGLINFNKTLSDYEVKQIYLCKNKIPQNKLADIFSVSPSTIGLIQNNIIYTDVTKGKNTDKNKKFSHGEFSGNSKLTKKDVLEIMSLKGVKTQREIGKKYNVGDSVISRIHRGKSWKHITQKYNEHQRTNS